MKQTKPAFQKAMGREVMCGEGKWGYPNTVDFYFLKRQKINELSRFQILRFIFFGF